MVVVIWYKLRFSSSCANVCEWKLIIFIKPDNPYVHAYSCKVRFIQNSSVQASNGNITKDLLSDELVNGIQTLISSGG